MAAGKDTLFGKLALERGYITREQRDEAREQANNGHAYPAATAE